MKSLLFPILLLFLAESGISDSSNSTDQILDETVVIPTRKPTRFIDKVRAIGRKQAIGVKGKLMCGGHPVRNATVKLWDNDFFDPDDLIAETQVSPDGTFAISGLAISITKIDPQLRIYHNCRANSAECRRKITFTIPDTYINKGNKVSKWFDMGTPNMEIGVRHKEEPHCY